MILVTGATGFLGRHLVRELATRGLPVRALVRDPSAAAALLPPCVTCVAGDVRDPTRLDEAMRGIETVFHLAFQSVDREGKGFEEVNVEGTRRLIAATVRAGARKLALASTAGVYGHQALRNVDETTPPRPDTLLARSRRAAEDLALARHRNGELEITVIRHRFVYGEGDLALVPRWIRAVRRLPFLVAEGRARLSLVAAPDWAAAAVQLGLASSHEETPIWHVTDGRPISFREALAAVVARFGGRVPRLSLPLGPLLGITRAWEILAGIDPEVTSWPLSSIRLRLMGQDQWISSAKLAARFPDLRFRSFEQGLEDAAGWYSAPRFT